MSVRSNPKHIPEFTLAPVCYVIHPCRGRNMRIITMERDSQLQRQVSGKRGELIDHMIARRPLWPVIHSRQCGEQFKVVFIGQESQCFNDVLRFDENMHPPAELLKCHTKI